MLHPNAFSLVSLEGPDFFGKKIAFQLKIQILSQQSPTLQMFTGGYGVSVGFPCNIYGKGL